MKAAVFYGPKDIRVDEVEEPELREGSVKVKVDWCGICGTDLHEYLAGPIFVPPEGSPHPITHETLPLTLGHEFAGEIEEVGEGSRFSVGEKVAINPVYFCGECTECLRGDHNLCKKLGFYGLMGGGGGMSEHAVVPEYMINPLPEGLTTEQGALVEPIAVGLRAVRRSGLKAGDSAVVFGAGPIGAVTVQCLKALGAGTIIVCEVAEARKKKALEIGADHVVDPSKEDAVAGILDLTDGDGADVSFDCAGIQPTYQMALKATRKGGVFVVVAIWEGEISHNPNDVVLKELDVRGIICYSQDDFRDTIQMLKDGKFDTAGLITERVPLSEVVERGFEELVAHKDRHVKILVDSGS
ncbi:Threonine dehydrogenase and related Zn-dependent dehydrogenase [Rubrobacter radiotolerans]|uniref:2,3-butanediol dehydrogenase n=1 Tax=Rubrobacter radiotolerans TaxID=42256 RepID=A0A023X0J8_RUBRA|nr:2,3-butanediol dehydrogenase [Rubrobacter radiotolerans]AHY45873.1 Threonine dehydrogenase and related Zn-dependent dehydrogenase [Rubrobacter radiotolerans]MDX5893286.1 2,3-butanediol dehydrogenase [Rubrobacter radiotolerans]SMC03428.1 (R,R)-butanediol dehydrogenase / meso-butanediol dehydrogenase / diacetyl reductase [Rubrobacter radiotolerans DSM 5868]